MSENSLRSKKTLNDKAPLEAHRSNHSSSDCSSLVRRKKRKNSSISEKSQRKRKRREKDQRKNSSSGPKTYNELYSDSKLRGSNSDDTTPPVSQRSHNSTQDLTCLGKRKNSSNALGQSQRKRSGEDEDDSTEEDVSFEMKSKKINSGPVESQSGSNDPYTDNALREELERKYVQLDRLGAGGNGSVYAGYRRDDNLPVAIKHIPISNVIRTAMTEDGVQVTFPLEVLLMFMAGQVKDEEMRRFSVALLNFYEFQEELVLVMERPVPSKDLFDYTMDGGRPLVEDEAKVILRQLVEGMIHIHSNGVLHRDIKPENILIQMRPEGPHLHILDFGSACAAREGPYTQVSGTAIYTPPEWYLQRSYQAVPCTVWQVGLVLHFMLCGTYAFRNSTQIVSKEMYIPDELSQECKDLLRSCLAKQPEERPSLNSILEHPWLNRA